MKVEIDEVWATPSTLHARVLVWGKDGRWRHKHWVSVPIASIPPEALDALRGDPDRDWRPDRDSEDVPLF